jgi:hypothetical protein
VIFTQAPNPLIMVRCATKKPMNNAKLLKAILQKVLCLKLGTVNSNNRWNEKTIFNTTTDTAIY